MLLLTKYEVLLLLPTVLVVIPMVCQFGAHSKNIRAQSLTVKSSRDSIPLIHNQSSIKVVWDTSTM